jgi:hypothetical protein
MEAFMNFLAFSVGQEACVSIKAVVIDLHTLLKSHAKSQKSCKANLNKARKVFKESHRKVTKRNGK